MTEMVAMAVRAAASAAAFTHGSLASDLQGQKPLQALQDSTRSGAERLLWEACERALRQPRDKVAVVLHLSSLAAPAPRAHHLRVARVLLQDTAQRFGGQVFALRNQDLVLLCTQAADSHGEQAYAPANLPRTFARLFAADVPDPRNLTSLWHLEQDRPALLAYLALRTGAPAEPEGSTEAVPATALSLATLQEIVSHAPLADLMVQQTGMSLNPDRSLSVAQRLAPSFRELSLSLAALNLWPLIAQAISDPFLNRYFATQLDAKLIQLLFDDLQMRGRLTRPSVGGGLPIHMELGLEAILSSGFARLARAAQSAGVRFGVAVPLIQACSDMELMDHARKILSLNGCDLILNAVDPMALLMIRPRAIQPDLVKLTWSPILAEAAAEPGGHAALQLAHALRRVDIGGLALQGTDSELALAWGQGHGITLFQGPYLDQVQAATRMARCHSAGACTLRQCCGRGTALGVAGRAGCGNPALLDSGFSLAPMRATAR